MENCENAYSHNGMDLVQVVAVATSCDPLFMLHGEVCAGGDCKDGDGARGGHSARFYLCT